MAKKVVKKTAPASKKSTATKTRTVAKPLKTAVVSKKVITKKVTKAKVSKKTTTKKSTVAANQSPVQKIVSLIKSGESYTSLVLGVIAVIIATILLLSVFNSRQVNRQTPDATPTTVAGSDGFEISPTAIAIEEPKGLSQDEKPSPTKATIKPSGKTYTVVKGDNLWVVAEKVYGSGYNWVDLAKANKLAHPGDIHVGNVLSIPEVTLKEPTVMTADEENSSTTAKISGEKYKILPNDNLWMIAVRAYGDGYKWVEIAKANKLEDPNIIHVGNELKIPRK